MTDQTPTTDRTPADGPKPTPDRKPPSDRKPPPAGRPARCGTPSPPSTADTPSPASSTAGTSSPANTSGPAGTSSPAAAPGPTSAPDPTGTSDPTGSLDPTGASDPTGRPPKATLAAYARLAKLDIYDYYLGLALVWTLLTPAVRPQPATFGLLVLILLAEITTVAAMVAFDDITGHRDGSDAANYGSDAARRRLARKPLVAGTLTEAQALRFAWAMTVASAGLWATAVALAPYRPLWAIALVAVCLVAAVQYSWGLKISYRGFQELFLAGLGVGWVLAPYGLLAGEAGGFVVVQAVLFGWGPMIFGLYSNTNDIAGDRAAGRRTVAAALPAAANRAFVVTLTAVESLLVVGATVAGVAPWWFPILLAPVFVLRVRQLVIGFWRGDILRGRRTAIRTHRVMVALLITANLAAPALSGISL
ncbi:UbiA family prenyltransferase [Nonomuraea sp. NPDC050404]|uniref:UbiA family prenyltransferase n=1 Tax=Nonomuraea sp. NPDC050404 TaxID=3155783 RepID=UPI0033FA9433